MSLLHSCPDHPEQILEEKNEPVHCWQCPVDKKIFGGQTHQGWPPHKDREPCVNGPGYPLKPLHGPRVATWIMRFRRVFIPVCDDCKLLMEPWTGAVWEKVDV